MKKILASLVFKIIVIAAVIVACYFAVQSFVGNLSSGLRLMDTPTVVKEIKNISELATATYVDDVVINDTIIKSRDVSKINLSSSLFSGEFIKNETVTDKVHFVEIATGRVRVGFDLKKIQDGDISVNDKELAITLPKAEILDVIMNPSDISHFYEEKTGEWTDQELHDAKTSAYTKAVETVKQRAIENGIIERAEQIGKSKLVAMFKGFGFENVVINVN